MRSRGFGVHSPSAFDFIRHVACERLPYYGYERLAAESPDKRTLAQAKLALRVANRLQPRSVAMTGSPAVLATAVRLACSSAEITADIRSDTSLLIAPADDYKVAETALAKGIAVLLTTTDNPLSRDSIISLMEAISGGHIIYDPQLAAIALPRADLVPQIFEVTIPR